MVDYLIVGAGLFGSVCAYELHNTYKKSVIVIEKRNHIGGNVYTEERDGIQIHMYGPHIFHTSNEKIWKWVNQFLDFNNYTHRPVANYKGEIYSLPFSMWTFNKMWGVVHPDEAKKIIKEQSKEISGIPKNMEEQAISLVGRDIYEKLVRGYSRKNWLKDPKDLPPEIIKRLPVRYTYDNNYFNDTYQGIPIGGYTQLFEQLLDGMEVITEVDYFDKKEYWDSITDNTIYTGPIDRYFDYRFGRLEYLTREFVHVHHTEVSNWQGSSMVNYTDEDEELLRITEHKHFEGVNTDTTWVTWEYPREYEEDSEPYYPLPDRTLYKKYSNLIDELSSTYFGGRLAEYRYYDMHQVIGSALKKVREWV